jgi:hypothetical protein
MIFNGEKLSIASFCSEFSFLEEKFVSVHDEENEEHTNRGKGFASKQFESRRFCLPKLTILLGSGRFEE